METGKAYGSTRGVARGQDMLGFNKAWTSSKSVT